MAFIHNLGTRLGSFVITNPGVKLEQSDVLTEEDDDTTREADFSEVEIKGKKAEPLLPPLIYGKKVDPCKWKYLHSDMSFMEYLRECAGVPDRDIPREVKEASKKPAKTLDDKKIKASDIETDISPEELIASWLKRKRVEPKVTGWGGFGLVLGVDGRKINTLFKDAYKSWNDPTRHYGEFNPTPSDDKNVERNIRPGMRIALTTNPRYTKYWKGLVKFTAIDLTIYSGDTPAADDIDLSYLGLTYLKPVLERIFLDVGLFIFKEDPLWLEPTLMNPRLGVAYHFQGTPLETPDKALDVTGRNSMSQSYTMFGLNGGFRVVPGDGVAEFLCEEVGQEDCWMAGRPNDEYFPQANGGNYLLGSQIFGEQWWGNGFIAYEISGQYHCGLEKVETAGRLSFNLHIGDQSVVAIRFFIEGDARKLWSIDDDDNPIIADEGYEYGLQAGLGFSAGRD